jgi:hypothetical protein
LGVGAIDVVTRTSKVREVGYLDAHGLDHSDATASTGVRRSRRE